MSDCPFCGKRNVSEEWIIAEDEDYYCAPTIGQITDGGHVLLVPHEHVSCLGALNSTALRRAESWAERLDRALVQTYGESAIFFEHGRTGKTVPHAHLHAAPVGLSEVFAFALKSYDFAHGAGQTVRLCGNLREVCTVTQRGQHSYLLWGAPNNWVVVLTETAKQAHFRHVLAGVVGYPERADWRNADPDLDRSLYLETAERLRPLLSETCK